MLAKPVRVSVLVSSQSECSNMNEKWMKFPWWTAAALLLLVGCSGGDSRLSRVEVSGLVYVNDKPLKQGQITFKPMDGTPGPSVGGEIVDGTFKIPEESGPCQGTHRVEIRAVRSTGRKVSGGMDSSATESVDEVEQFIPREYNANSKLQADVSPETANGLAFKLEIPGG